MKKKVILFLFLALFLISYPVLSYSDSIDTDNDNITNALDLDDDNDGIPDTEESICGVSDMSVGGTYSNGSSVPNPGAIAQLGSITPTITITPGNGSSLKTQTYRSSGITGNNFAGYRYLFTNTQVNDPTIIEINFGVPVSNVSLYVGDIDNTSSNEEITVYAYNGTDPVILGPSNFTILVPGTLNYDGVATLWGTGDSPPNSNNGVFRLDIPEEVTKIVLSYRNRNVVNNTFLTISNIAYCDISLDSDGDGIPNRLDLDSDNDGIADVVEAGGLDPDSDGIIGTGPITDTDGDGLSDIVDTDEGGTPLANPDTDGDSLPDTQDIDSDNDGIPDNIESQPTHDYIAPSGKDTDGDGWDDAYDPDNGGIPISVENTDGDGTPDYVDNDSDNDGIPDIIENGNSMNILSGNDSDGDGLDDNFDTQSNPGQTGVPNNVNNGINPPGPNNLGDEDGDFNVSGGDVDYRDIKDSDGDGIADRVDIDDDNDGIPDTEEYSCTAYTLIRSSDLNIPANVVDYTMPAPVDVSNMFNLPAGSILIKLTKANTKSNGTLVVSADHHTFVEISGKIPVKVKINHGRVVPAGVKDQVYSLDGVTYTFISTLDNGLISGVNNNEYYVKNTTSSSITNTASLTWESNDFVTVFELSSTHTPLNNGISFRLCPAKDSDGDGIPDHLDLDSDNDGIPDNIESQPTDDYAAPTGKDSDGDGWDDAYDPDNGGTPISIEDTDGDGTPDYLDIDSDNDGDNDALEGWDGDNDGIPDIIPSGTDADRDGLDDAYDNDDTKINPTNDTTPTSYPDLDNPGNDRDWREVKNLHPTATDDVFTGNEDSTITGNVITGDNGNGADSDPESDTLTVTRFTIDGTDYTPGSSAHLPEGVLSISNDGSLSFIPAPDYNGALSEDITYTISDGNGGTDTAHLNIIVTNSNDPPDAVDDSANTNVDTPVNISVLTNDSDPDMDPLTVTGTTAPTHGNVTINADGTLTYTPDHGYIGTDMFTYTINDGNGGVDTARVTVTVTGVTRNQPPIATNNLSSTDPGTPVTIDVLGNDSDPDGDNLEITGTTEPAHGTVIINPDGTITYIPDPGFKGTDTFEYTISDGNGHTVTATVTVKIGLQGIIAVPTMNEWGQIIMTGLMLAFALYYIKRYSI